MVFPKRRVQICCLLTGSENSKNLSSGLGIQDHLRVWIVRFSRYGINDDEGSSSNSKNDRLMVDVGGKTVRVLNKKWTEKVWKVMKITERLEADLKRTKVIYIAGY